MLVNLRIVGISTILRFNYFRLFLKTGFFSTFVDKSYQRNYQRKTKNYPRKQEITQKKVQEIT